MMSRRSSLLVIAGLVSGIWLAGSFAPLPVAASQRTKTEVKQEAREKGEQGQDKWQSMTPEEQQQAKEKGKAGAEKKQEQWQSLTPEQQQAAKEKGQKGAQKTKKKWQSLPE